MSRLFLCEKPSQARDVAKALGINGKGDGCITGNGITVAWCFGHLFEQAPPESYVEKGVNLWDVNRLPVIPSQWRLEVKSDAKKQFGVVSKLLEQASEVVISTDADREGETIAREVLNISGYRGKLSRLWLSALDDASVKKALKNLLPGDKTLPLYYAGLARARADWLVGMNLTIAYTSVFRTEGGKKGVLSVGRVQTPTLAIVVARDREIENFKPKDFYSVTATWLAQGGSFQSAWVPPANMVDDKGRCLDKKLAQMTVDKVKGQVGRIVKAETVPKSAKCPLPYYLSTLTQDASRLWGSKAKDVSDAAQALYEKHKAISYIGTKCPYLPETQYGERFEILEILKRLDSGMAPLIGSADINFKSHAWKEWTEKLTAEYPHPAIIPTPNPSVDLSKMSDLERKLYDLVRRRYIAQFLGDYEYLQTTIEVVCQGETFRATGRTPIKQGWKLAEIKADATKKSSRRKPSVLGDESVEDDEVTTTLPKVVANEQVKNQEAEVLNHQTTPPDRYTEGTLIKDMESIGKMVTDPKLRAVLKETAGIGTDRTRADIIQSLFLREYFRNEGKKYIISTDKGRALVDMLPPSLTDPATTARWEQALEAIAEGKARLDDFMRLQEQWVTEMVGKVKLEAKGRPPRQAGNSGDPRYPCPQCHKLMRLVPGQKGAFWGCTGYPECKHTLPDDNGKPGVRDVSGKSSSAETHPAGGRRDPLPGQVGETCPECKKGTLVQRFSKEKNRHFIGCNSFPACRYFKWDSQESTRGAIATG